MSLPDEEAFVPKAEHDKLIEEVREIRAAIEKIIEERNQLREALSKVNAGIHPARDELQPEESTIVISDQKVITDLAFLLLKVKHPQSITITQKPDGQGVVSHI